MENRRLTPKQRAFADYYIETGNATQSALKAGYSKNTASAIGHENLRKPNVKKYIDDKMQEIADKRIMGATEALELLTSIARGEIIEEVVVSSFEGAEKVEKIPDIRDRQRAAEELLKRYSLSDNDKLRNEMMRAQIDKTKAEIDRINKESHTDAPPEITIVDTWADDNE